MLCANSSPNKINSNNTPTIKNFGLFTSNNPSAFNLTNNNDNNKNNKNTPNNPDQFQGNQAYEITKFLDLLPKSDFKRGFIKTQENHHYYLLNEIQSNNYSKSFSAVKYVKKTNSLNSETNFVLSGESFLIKFYSKDLLSEYFTESELLDFKYSLGSKYKSLGLADKHIQKIFEIIIANDCVLVVTELYEHTLKEYLIQNKDLCKSSYLTSQLEIRIEWFFGKLIFNLVNKLNNLKKKNLFLGGLINTSDIYIRNFDFDYNDILELDDTNMNVLEDIDFVFSNPFFYEIETLFKLLNNGPLANIYPPEFLNHFKYDNAKYGLVLVDENVFIFRSKEEKEIYDDKHEDDILFAEGAMKSINKLKTTKIQSIYSKLNSGVSEIHIDDVIGESNKKLNDIDNKNSDKNEKDKLKRFVSENQIIYADKKERKSGGVFSSLFKKKKEGKLKENINSEDELTEVNLLVSIDQKIKFDAWMIGMLIFEIIFNKYPDNIVKLKDLNELKDFYFVDALKKSLGFGKKSVGSKDPSFKFGSNLIKFGINKDIDKNRKKITFDSPDKQNAGSIGENILMTETIPEKKQQKMFTFSKSDISNVMKDLLSYCFKIDSKSRVYPNFDDCSEENIRNLKIHSEAIESEMSINENENLSMTMGKNYDVHETFEILKGEGKNQYIDFIIRKNEYVKLIIERRSKYIDTFHSKFFYNQVKINTDKIEENKKKTDKIYL